MKISRIGIGMLFASLTLGTVASELSLTEIEQLTLARDPKQQQFYQQAESLRSQGIAKSQLADPMLKMGLANLPTDTFSLDQDPMTQLSLGLAQQFSRGDSRQLTRAGFEQQAEITEFQAQLRQLEALKQVRTIWFQLHYSLTAQRLVSQNKELFGPMKSYVETQFELGMKQSQDVLKAELELSKFDELQARFAQQESMLRGQLAGWLGQDAYRELATELPQWPQSNTLAQAELTDVTHHYKLFKTHPLLVIAEQRIALADNQVALAQQTYKPAFKVEVGYGSRMSQNPDGTDRPDLLSGFVTMDVPLFTDNRQDRTVAAAESGKGAAQAERDALVYQMSGQFSQYLASFQQSDLRMQRYQNTLLPQARQRTESVEQGYRSNTTSFDQVIQAYMDELNLELEYHQLHFDNQISLTQIRYFQGL